MKRVLLAIGSLLAAGTALACQPPLPNYLEFPRGSSELTPAHRAGLRDIARAVKVHLPKCSSFGVLGHVDPSEPAAAMPARLAAIVKTLVEEGALAAHIEAHTDTVRPDHPGFGKVDVRWRPTDGRWRCDPASKSEGAQTACAPIYAHCYLELVDGTTCNIFGVPNPGPRRYSVDPNGKKLD